MNPATTAGRHPGRPPDRWPWVWQSDTIIGRNPRAADGFPGWFGLRMAGCRARVHRGLAPAIGPTGRPFRPHDPLALDSGLACARGFDPLLRRRRRALDQRLGHGGPEPGGRGVRPGQRRFPYPARHGEDGVRDRPAEPGLLRRRRPSSTVERPFSPRRTSRRSCSSSRSSWARPSSGCGALAATGRFRLFTLNNESRELHEYRVRTFGLCSVFHVVPHLLLPRPGQAR